MFTPLTRFLLGVTVVVLGVIQIVNGQPLGWLLIAAAALLAYGHFKQSTIALAFQAYRRSNLDEVERRLGQLKHPEQLAGRDRTYYDFLSGILAQRSGDLERARVHLTAAAAGPLRTESLRSVVHCHLAAVAIETGDFEAGRRHVDAARGLDHSAELERVLGDLHAKLPSEEEAP